MAIQAKRMKQSAKVLPIKSAVSASMSASSDMVAVEVLKSGFYGGIYYTKGQKVSMVAKTAAHFMPPYGSSLKKA